MDCEGLIESPGNDEGRGCRDYETKQSPPFKLLACPSFNLNISQSKSAVVPNDRVKLKDGNHNMVTMNQGLSSSSDNDEDDRGKMLEPVESQVSEDSKQNQLQAKSFAMLKFSQMSLNINCFSCVESPTRFNYCKIDAPDGSSALVIKAFALLDDLGL